jgi:hypothetical protein
VAVAAGVVPDRPPMTTTPNGRLLDYYLHTAVSASRLIPRRTSGAEPSSPRQPPAWGSKLVTEKERPKIHLAGGNLASTRRLRWSPTACGGLGQAVEEKP